MGIYTTATIAYGLEISEDWKYEHTVRSDEDEYGEFELDPYGEHPNAKKLQELGLDVDTTGDSSGYSDCIGYVIVIPETVVSVSSSCEFVTHVDLDKIRIAAQQVDGGVSRDSTAVKIREFLESIGLDWGREADWMLYWSRG